MQHYFVDTSFIIGIYNTQDKFHKEASTILKDEVSDHEILLFTSDYVVDEFLSYTTKKIGINRAISYGEKIFENKIWNIHYSTQNLIETAWNTFKNERNERKPLNFTDCVILANAELLNVEKLLTFDNRLSNYFKKE